MPGSMKNWLPVVLASLWLGGCGTGGNDEPVAADACGAPGHPCLLSDVPLQVHERSEALGDEVLARADGGATLAELHEFLRAQNGVIEASLGTSGLRFRLQGGRAVWILHPDSLATAPPAAAAAAAASPATALKSLPARTLVEPKHVVGATPTNKRALVLSPFKHEFAERDDGATVAAILESTRGYAGNVTYLYNAEKTSQTVGIEQFKGWRNHDVIHVTGHGISICDLTRCTSTILTGDYYSSAADLLQITEAGVNTARVIGDAARYFVVGADFFRTQYPGGLDRTIVFFNGCQTLGQTGAIDSSLADALIGEGSVFLGWTEVVHSQPAFDAAEAWYRELSDHGLTASRAWDELGERSVDTYDKDGSQINAFLRVHRQSGRDLRLREVVSLEHPTHGAMLSDGAIVAAVGFANDGAADLVPYQVLVEGIPEDQQDVAMVQVAVPGYASTPSPASAGERVGKAGWRLSGQFPYIDLQSSQSVVLVVTLTLPEGGTSVHTVTVTLTADAAGGGGGGGGGDGGGAERWLGTSTLTRQLVGGDLITLAAETEFVQTEASVGSPYSKRLRVASGRLFWTRSGTTTGGIVTPPCDYVTGPIEVPILPETGEILIDVATGVYSMFGSTQGPLVTAAANCGAFSFSTRAGGSWLPPLSESNGQSVVPPGAGTLGGTWTSGGDQWTWSFTRQ
jgi:hypothetical protein